jgi:hypothetical protein
LSVDNEACLAWLDGALGRAFEDGKPELWAYLEAVMEKGYFEMQGGGTAKVVTYPAEGV